MIPYIKGKITNQAHVNIPENTYEEEYAREGFFGRYAHLYRSHPPVAWTSIEGPLRPQAFDLTQNKDLRGNSSYLENRELVLSNSDVEIALIRLAQEMPYFFRNADADEIFFVHKGNGEFLCDFGPLYYEEGDYIVVPRGTVFKWNPKHYSEFLNITSFSEVRFPDKGMIGQHALFDPAVIRVPTPQIKEENEKRNELYELRIRRQGEITKVKYPHNPIDVVGWKGTLTVWQLNVRDIRPISSESYHLPPSAHTTFVANGFVVCSFLPRPLENGDPKAMKVPFYHSNIDYDEVLFYHAGQFFSRAGIQPGMLTFHPQGIHHGPQADAVTRSKNVERTNETAIMIDTKKPLNVCENARKFENVDYWKSWMK